MSCTYPEKGALTRLQDKAFWYLGRLSHRLYGARLGQTVGLEGRPPKEGPPSLRALARAVPEVTNTKTVPTVVSNPPIPAFEVMAVDSNSVT